MQQKTRERCTVVEGGCLTLLHADAQGRVRSWRWAKLEEANLSTPPRLILWKQEQESMSNRKARPQSGSKGPSGKRTWDKEHTAGASLLIPEDGGFCFKRDLTCPLQSDMERKACLTIQNRGRVLQCLCSAWNPGRRLELPG